MDGFSAVARILKLEGVEWVACYPSNNLIESGGARGYQELSCSARSGGAVMAADGYSRASNRQKFGVVITQGASGAENAMGGIAQAFGDNIPILLIPGGSALNAWNIRPNFSPSRAYAPISKQTEVVLTPVGNWQLDAPGVPRAAKRTRRPGYARDSGRRDGRRRSGGA